jgi:hypothetical protein
MLLIRRHLSKPPNYCSFVLFLCIDGCYSCVLVRYYPHQHHLANDKLVVPCITICLLLPSTHHHRLLPFSVVGLSHSLCHGEIVPCPIVLCMWSNSFAIEKNGIFFAYACKTILTFTYACKKNRGKFWIICNFFHKCFHFKLFCKVGFGLLVH